MNSVLNTASHACIWAKMKHGVTDDVRVSPCLMRSGNLTCVCVVFSCGSMLASRRAQSFSNILASHWVLSNILAATHSKAATGKTVFDYTVGYLDYNANFNQHLCH